MIQLNGMIASSIVAVLLLVLLAFYLVKRNKDPYNRLKKRLRPYKIKESKNLIIPDGIGGLIEIEHLLLLEQGLLLIKTFESNGHIFGSHNIDLWTEIANGRSAKFANPLRHMQTTQQALSVLAPGVPIYYRIIFLGKASFPKGQPGQVSILSTLENDLAFLSSKPKLGNKLQDAWERILRIARSN